MSGKKQKVDSRPNADQYRAQKAAHSRQEYAAVADIGELPPVDNPERKESCRLDLHKFLATYFPASTGLSPFSEDHQRVIERLQRCILDGGLFVNALPRGFAKTTISENSAVWAALYGHRKFIPIFSSEAGAAAGNTDSIKLELAENDLLVADFPEACHAIRALEGKVQRSHSQTYQGVLTHIEWKADTIVLPTIPESAASGAIIAAHGITAAARGMKHKRPGGTQQRPDFILIDDPQTDESAGSDLQITKRLDVLRKCILKLGGHDRKMAAVVNATVIRPGDMIEQLLDAKKFPAWQGERIKMVRKWADAHDTLWMTSYAELRNTVDPDVPGDQRRAHAAATDFYREHRAEMDEGCEVAWEHCFNRDTEISAVQHAYNLLIDDGPEVFASECQNEPLEPEVQNAAEMLSADRIAEKTNNLDRGAVPLSASRVVSFIDVQKEILYYAVAAFDDGFGGAVIDYGTWPKQDRSYFSATGIPPSRAIAAVTKAAGLEAQIYAALETLTGDLAAREWKREDGAVMKLDRAGIDANWGESSDVIYEFCRRSAHSAILVPSHGKYVGAISKPFREYAKKTGDKTGLNWRMPVLGNRRVSRYVLFDTNFWKSFVQSRLSTAMGGRGCLSLFGGDSQAHKLFADHLTAEQGIKVEAKGKSVIEWKLRPTRPDNHWLDCLVGCHVLASMQGVHLAESAGAAHRAIRKAAVSFAEKTKTRKVWRPNQEAVRTR